MQDDGFELGHFLDGPPGPFLTDPTSLEPPVRHQVGTPERSPVDVDAAGIDLTNGADSPATSEVKMPAARP
jgi:hypothetical protein